MTPAKLLIIEDDPDIAYLLERSLRREGYQTALRQSGNGIIDAVSDFEPDILLLDLMLPGLNGYDLCRIVKEATLEKETRVIMLTAKSDEADKLVGFRCGADDYITKPFHMQEVLARVRALLRRSEGDRATKGKPKLEQGPIAIDDARHEVLVNREPLALTLSEYRLLRLMASQPERVFTREQLSNSISDSERANGQGGRGRSVDVHIRSLRKKLGDNASLICTLRGVGYYFIKQSVKESATV